MMRLIKTPDSSVEQSAIPDSPACFAECRVYREIDQLLWRVLQLDEILHHRCIFNPEKAARIKRQLGQKQAQLEQVYRQIGEGKEERSVMRRVDT